MKIQIKSKNLNITEKLLYKLDDISGELIALTGDDDFHVNFEIECNDTKNDISAMLFAPTMCYKLPRSTFSFKRYKENCQLQNLNLKVSQIQDQITNLKRELESLRGLT